MSKPISRFNFNMPTETRAYVASVAATNGITETDVVLHSIQLMQTLGKIGITTHFVINPQKPDEYSKDIIMPFDPKPRVRLTE
jgi:hypothetical protein